MQMLGPCAFFFFWQLFHKYVVLEPTYYRIIPVTYRTVTVVTVDSILWDVPFSVADVN